MNYTSMKIKSKYLLLIILISFIACQSNKKTNSFEVSGTFLNTPSKKIFLAELPFGSTQRTILDSATIDNNGRFSLKTVAKGEGLYQVFVEKGPGIMLINNVNKMEINADANKLSQYTITGGTVNNDMKKMFNEIVSADSIMRKEKMEQDSLLRAKAKDSVVQIAIQNVGRAFQKIQFTLENFIQKQANGTAVYFTLGIAREFEEEEKWKLLLEASLKRFPNHPGLQLLKVNTATANPADDTYGQQFIGKPVPDIALPDTSGKIISVSSFKGKWLLIDFWASWCGPCRAENPNVVATYNKFKDKNFTILGISLDDNKASWIKAIQKDGLNWTHISDLKQWQSKAVQTYNFDGIPFNILVDPSGVVKAVSLRGEDLQNTLSKYILKK